MHASCPRACLASEGSAGFPLSTRRRASVAKPVPDAKSLPAGNPRAPAGPDGFPLGSFRGPVEQRPRRRVRQCDTRRPGVTAPAPIPGNIRVCRWHCTGGSLTSRWRFFFALRPKSWARLLHARPPRCGRAPDAPAWVGGGCPPVESQYQGGKYLEAMFTLEPHQSAGAAAGLHLSSAGWTAAPLRGPSNSQPRMVMQGFRTNSGPLCA